MVSVGNTVDNWFMLTLWLGKDPRIQWLGRRLWLVIMLWLGRGCWGLVGGCWLCRDC